MHHAKNRRSLVECLERRALPAGLPLTEVVYLSLESAGAVTGTDGVRISYDDSDVLRTTIERNDFRHNTSAIEVEGGGDALGLSVRGNHWSDYEGFDLNEDGTGDVAFEVKALSRTWSDEQPALAFFRESVAMHALDVVSQSLPLFAARLLVRDEAPSMQRSKP